MATETAVLRIEGMTCDGCSQTVKQALERDASVSEARVSWEDGLAQVTYDPDATDEEQILANRVFRRQYRAELLPRGGCC